MTCPVYPPVASQILSAYGPVECRFYRPIGKQTVLRCISTFGGLELQNQ